MSSRDALTESLLLSRSRAIAEALFSDHGELHDDRIDWVIQDLDHFLRCAGTRPRLIFTLCVTALSLLAPLAVGKLTTLAALPVSERSAVLHKTEGGLLGPAALAAKAILCILWFEHPDVDREVRGR